MTSSYLRTFLRISALRCSTVVWARSTALVTMRDSMGTSSGNAADMTRSIIPEANSRISSSSREM